jgi:hypothetical protein
MWLTSEEIDDMGESYYLYHIRERYFEYMDFFCENCKSDEAFQPEQCVACQVFAFKERLRSLDPDELKEFAHQTTPHAPVKINLDNYHKFLQWNDIEIPFCSGLQKIPLKPRNLSSASTVKYLGSDNREYMLTTIAVPKSRANNHKIKVLCTEIWKNTEKQDLACNRLISDGVDVRSLRSGAIVIGPNAMFADEANISEQEQIKILDVDKFISDNTEKEHGQT